MQKNGKTVEVIDAEVVEIPTATTQEPFTLKNAQGETIVDKDGNPLSPDQCMQLMHTERYNVFSLREQLKTQIAETKNILFRLKADREGMNRKIEELTANLIQIKAAVEKQ
jgi:hypothetical protein